MQRSEVMYCLTRVGLSGDAMPLELFQFNERTINARKRIMPINTAASEALAAPFPQSLPVRCNTTSKATIRTIPPRNAHRGKGRANRLNCFGGAGVTGGG